MSLILLINRETEPNHYDSIGIQLNAAEWHCAMKVMHKWALQGCCEWKRKYQDCVHCFGKAEYLQLKKVLRLKSRVQQVWLSAMITIGHN